MFIELLSVSTLRSFAEFLDFNSKRSLRYLTLSSRPCQDRPKIVNTISDKTLSWC